MKRTVIIIFIMSIILIVGCSPQKELTQEQIANMSDEEIYAYYEEDAQAIAGEADASGLTFTCEDSDFGKMYIIKGTTTGTVIIGRVTTPLSPKTDQCEDSVTLKEFYCDRGTHRRLSISYTCEQNCLNGACVTCRDNDEGNDINIKGVVTNGKSTTGEILSPQIDNCYAKRGSRGNVLAQYECKSDGEVKRTVIDCPATSPNCGDGICRY